MNGGVTHPLIANDIADYTGATIAQRDSIVHKKHWGTWKPDPHRKIRRKKVMVKPVPPPATWKDEILGMTEKTDQRKEKGRAVYAVDKDGKIVRVYHSLATASLQTGVDKSAIYARCNKRLAENEFLVNEITFRYADEYDEEEEEKVARKGAEAREAQKTGAWRYGASWYMRIDGKTQSLRDWAEETGIKPFTLATRIRSGMAPEEAIKFKDMRGGNRK